MSELQVFSNADFGNVRAVEIDGKTYFVGTDVARALGYADQKSTVNQHCRGVVKHPLIDRLGREQKASFIPEGDVYRLIVRSKLPTAEKFERWAFDEVLPSTRKYGAYLTPAALESLISSPEFGIRLLTALKDEREISAALRAQAEIDAPKAAFYDQVTKSEDVVDMGTAAKILNMGVGRNRLFQILRDADVLMWNNVPYQRYVDSKWFRVTEKPYTNRHGEERVSAKTVVFQKGLDEIRRILDSASGSRLVLV